MAERPVNTQSQSRDCLRAKNPCGAAMRLAAVYGWVRKKQSVWGETSLPRDETFAFAAKIGRKFAEIMEFNINKTKL
ncbi:MAG: hypothetical protein AB7F98_13445 [Novosphingobium sp.]